MSPQKCWRLQLALLRARVEEHQAKPKTRPGPTAPAVGRHHVLLNKEAKNGGSFAFFMDISVFLDDLHTLTHSLTHSQSVSQPSDHESRQTARKASSSIGKGSICTLVRSRLLQPTRGSIESCVCCCGCGCGCCSCSCYY